MIEFCPGLLSKLNTSFFHVKSKLKALNAGGLTHVLQNTKGCMEYNSETKYTCLV